MISAVFRRCIERHSVRLPGATRLRNARGVVAIYYGVHALPFSSLLAQIRSVLDDLKRARTISRAYVNAGRRKPAVLLDLVEVVDLGLFAFGDDQDPIKRVTSSSLALNLARAPVARVIITPQVVAPRSGRSLLSAQHHSAPAIAAFKRFIFPRREIRLGPCVPQLLRNTSARRDDYRKVSDRA
jgi:hypothetical protein